ncbi:MAG: DUF3987 domain-containing protein [Cyanobacteria bacterium]|nr:DUF3987 domain-containing protein [Cyanobacteriota bacterium]MDW8199592.1 DUF3987 domain-containing protein [Cyanobacteriota bacterium SKYGB_h_bin112]
MLSKIVAHTRNGCKFDIRNYIEVHNGRASCPSCEQDGKLKQKNLQVNDNGKYWCYRGCTPEQIRAALNAPLPFAASAGFSVQEHCKQEHHKDTKVTKVGLRSPQVFSRRQVQQSVDRLLSASQPDQQQALCWLEGRGFTRDMIRHFQLGLERYPLKDHPQLRYVWAIALHIPVPNQPGQFYRKLRIAPWLTGDDRPDGLSRWSQYGVPATVWLTYHPENATETWFCEGEWDGMRLGWEAQQQGASIAVACSTAGCGTIPPLDQLDPLPGTVTIFFDRNDEPRKDGVVPGEAGAEKLALVLGDRGRIAQVPMPEDCPIAGWDVSNALDVGYTWQDFLTAAALAVPPSPVLHPPSASPSLRDQILTILRQHDSPGQREFALMELAQTAGYYYRDISHLAQALMIEVDLQTNLADAIQKLHNLLNIRHTQLNLHRYLEPAFAQQLIDTARAMPTAPEMLFTTLLPAAASRIGTGARVVVKPSAKYTQPMVFWTAVVADSGSLKTPVQRVIIDPLIALEKEAHDRYQLDLADYKAEQQAANKSQDGDYRQPPTRKRYVTKDVTLETLQRIHSENPRGILYYRDELVGNVKSRNMYRGGVGADEEAELDQWNGAAILYDRAEKSVCLAQSAVSRTGAYQWETLSQLMGDHTDFNGSFARWLLCAPKLPRRYLRLLQDDQDTGISEALMRLYRDLEQLPPQDYLLSYEAKQLLETWQHQLVDAQITESAVGLRAVYPKIESYTSRLALWLHLVNATLRGDRPTQVITGDTMEKAIELAAYYLWQYRLIYTHNSPDAGLEGPSLKLQRYAEKLGRVTASQAKSGVYALRRMPVEQIRQLMQTLVAAGHGTIEGVGAESVYIPSGQSVPTLQETASLSTPLNSFSLIENQRDADHQQLINSGTIDPFPEPDIGIDPDPQLPDQPSTAAADTRPQLDAEAYPLSPPAREVISQVPVPLFPDDVKESSTLSGSPPGSGSVQGDETNDRDDAGNGIDQSLLERSTSHSPSRGDIQTSVDEIDPTLKAVDAASIVPCPLAVGDRVAYIGNHPNLQRQYPGTLIVHSITSDGIACLTAEGRITTWLPPADLQRPD